MDQVIGRGRFVGRSLVAMLLTGLFSPLLLAMGTAVFFFIIEHSIKKMDGVAAFVGTVWFFGSFVAMPCAVLLGLLVEWPKIKWLMGLKPAGIRGSLFLSIAGAEILLLSGLTISAALQPPSQFSDGIGEGFLFVAVAAAIGGGCSGAFWWKLVVMPMRRARGA